MTLPLAAADALGEVGHAVQHVVDRRHHVLAVQHDRLAARGAEGDVQHGPPLSDVDLLALEHGVDALSQAALLGQLQQEPHGFVGDAVLGVVEVHADRLGRQALAALRVVGEELTEVQAADLLVVGCEGLPCRALRQRGGGGRHGRSPWVGR